MVTAMSLVWRRPFSSVRPSIAARIMSAPPKAWRLMMSTSSALSERMAPRTVLGMSQSLRSRKILCPRALISRTMSGPAA